MTQLSSETKQIGKHKFTVFMLPPFEAQDILIDLGQILGPALAKAAAAAKATQGNSLLEMDIDNPHISSGVSALLQGITKDKMRELVNTMAGVSHCDGTPLPDVMEMVFRGNLPLMYQWLWFALEVNFRNFTTWLGVAFRSVSNLRAVAQSLNTSGDTGQS